MKKITIYLSGGLGNQLFQYSFGRAMAIKNSCDLVIDDWSGFARDKLYKRDYELDNFQIKARKCSFIEKFFVWIFKIECYLFKSLKNSSFVERFYGEFRIDKNQKYEEKITQGRIRGNLWFIGYFQSPKYFESIKKEILDELDIPLPKQTNILEMGNKIINTESVALGIRLYEESKKPNSQARNGKLKTIKEINLIVKKILELVPNAKIYIFCTFKSPLLTQLILPDESVFLTKENGYKGTLETLWLLSKCKHHIFTNSSFYWWGAWLSQKNYSYGDQIVFAADNFKNIDTLPKEWNTF